MAGSEFASSLEEFAGIKPEKKLQSDRLSEMKLGTECRARF